MPSYRRSLGAMFGAILDGGFELAGLVEPRPDECFRRAAPEDYEKLSRMPDFLCFEVRKLGAR